MGGIQIRQGLLIGVYVLAAMWLLTHIWSLAGKAAIAVREAHNAEADYKALEKRKAVLQASIAALGTDLGRDAAIRTAFGVARPGEEVIVVVPPATATPTSTPAWWQKIFSWF